MNDIQQVETSEEEWSDSEDDVLYNDESYSNVASAHRFLNGHDYHKLDDDIIEDQKIDVEMTDSRDTYSDERSWNSHENICKPVDLCEKFVNNSTFYSEISNNLRRTRKTSREELPDLNDELLNGYKVLQHLMSPTNKNVNSPFMDRNEAVKQFSDYCDSIREPMWLNKVKLQLLSRKYNTITEVIHDIRLILENCYDYYGHSHAVSKRALKLELILEQKLALLPREMREKTTLEATSPALIKAAGNLLTGSRPPTASSDSSHILFYVTNSKLWKEKTNRKRHLEEKKAVKEANYVHVVEWEKQLTQEHLTAMKAMWEIPQIGHFLFLAQSALNIPELNMYELERIFLVPRESSYLATIITSLLSTPFQRTKLHQRPPMPYRIWKERVKLRIDNWYKLYYNRRSAEKVFKAYGIEPDFFRVLGEINPFEEKEFHELSFHQRVWVVKSLCDYCLHTHKTVQDAISENSLLDQKEFVLGSDRNGKIYVHFPQFCGQDLRIYCQSSSSDFTASNSLLHSKSASNIETETSNRLKVDVKNGDIRNGRNIGIINKKSSSKHKSVQPDIKKFELVVDGVESLRQLVTRFSISKDMLQSKNLRKKEKQEQLRCEIDLCARLYNLLDELERWESKLLNVVKRTQMRLKQEYDDYQTVMITGEEDIDDIWGTEPDDEEQHPVDSPCGNVASDSDDDFSITLYDSDSSTKQIGSLEQRKCRSKRKRYNFVTDEEENESSSDFEVSISSRGRLRKTRKINLDEIDYSVKTRSGNQNSKSQFSASNSVTECHTMKHYISNTTNQAKGQYEWETLRQIIISSNKNESNQECHLPEDTGQIERNKVENVHDEMSLPEIQQCVEEESNINCQQQNIVEESNINRHHQSIVEESHINCHQQSIVDESHINCHQQSIIEESHINCHQQSIVEESHINCQQQSVVEKSHINCQQQSVVEKSDVNCQNSDPPSIENYSGIPTTQDNNETDVQSSVTVQSGCTNVDQGNIEMTTAINHSSEEKLATFLTELQTKSQVICTDNPESPKIISQPNELSNFEPTVKPTSRPTSRLKSSGLFLHIPPRPVTYGTEQVIGSNIVDSKMTNATVIKNTVRKESNEKQEILVPIAKNRTPDESANKIKTRRTNKGPQNYQIFNFKLSPKPASTSPKLECSLLQPTNNQSNSIKHLIPAVDQKGNKVFLQCVTNMPVHAANNETRQDKQKTHSPLILNMSAAPVNTRVVLSNNTNVASTNVPFLLPVKQSGVNKVSSITTLPVQTNLANAASNVILSTSGCSLQDKSSVSLLPLNTQSQTVVTNPPPLSTITIPQTIFQQNNSASLSTNNTQLYLRVAQSTQNSAKNALAPLLKPSTSSNGTGVARTMTTTSHTLQMKSDPPPLGPITSTKNTSLLPLSINKLTSKLKEADQTVIKGSSSKASERTKNNSFLQLPPLGPITLPISPKQKKPNEVLAKNTQISQASITNVYSSNSSIQSSAISSQAITQVRSLISSNNNQLNMCVANSPGNAVSNKTPIKLMVSSNTPNTNYQFIMTHPPSTMAPTQVILPPSSIPVASTATSSNSVIFLPPTAKPQTVITAAPTITVPAGGNSNRTVPNILTKQPAKVSAKTPTQTLLTNNSSSVFNLPTNYTQEKDGIRTLLNGATILNSSPSNTKTVVPAQKQNSSVQYNQQQLFLLTSNGQLVQLNQVEAITGNQIVNVDKRHSATGQNVSYVLNSSSSQVLSGTTEIKNS